MTRSCAPIRRPGSKCCKPAGNVLFGLCVSNILLTAETSSQDLETAHTHYTKQNAMRKFLRLVVALSVILLALPPALQAQQRTVTGTVISEDGKTPLAGVTIRVRVPDVSPRPMPTENSASALIREKRSSSPTWAINPQMSNPVPVPPWLFRLKASDNTMGEVIVTAMDIKRNAREVGYSAQKVGGKEIAETQRKTS